MSFVCLHNESFSQQVRERLTEREKYSREKLLPGPLHIAGKMTHLPKLKSGCAPKRKWYPFTCKSWHMFNTLVQFFFPEVSPLLWVAEVNICHSDLASLGTRSAKNIFYDLFTPWVHLPSMLKYIKPNILVLPVNMGKFSSWLTYHWLNTPWPVILNLAVNTSSRRFY